MNTLTITKDTSKCATALTRAARTATGWVPLRSFRSAEASHDSRPSIPTLGNPHEHAVH